MRGYEGVCFRPEAHLSEIERGAAMFGIGMPLSTPSILEIVDEAAKRTGVSAAYVRVTLSRGFKATSRGMGAELTSGGTLSIVARPMDVPSQEAYAEGVATVT